MMSRHILIVDDEDNILRSLRLVLEPEGYTVSTAGSAAVFRNQSAAARPDLYLIDIRLPDGNGVDLLRELRQHEDRTPVVMISGHGTIPDAIEATRAGAFDFLEKPLARERVLLAVRNAIDRSSLERENARYRDIIGDAPRMIGTSPAFRRVIDQVDRAAASDARVLLIGESGTGKELLAERIHENSPFREGPFVKVNCAAIPTELIESELFGHEKGAFTGATTMRRGKFELANGGSILLDEVGDLHAASQAKLLRVLEHGEFQRLGGERTIRTAVRVISATNRDLESLVAESRFREDLYYRLSVVPIRAPALRERPADIRDLASYFLEEFCARNNFRRKQIDDAVFPVLERYAWPGNARELRNAVERMAILAPGDRITPESVPLEVRSGPDSAPSGLDEARDRAEGQRILRALEESDWNVSAAARALGIGRTNLHKRIRALRLRRQEPDSHADSA